MALGDKHNLGLPRTEASFSHPNTGAFITLPDGTYRGTDHNYGKCLGSPNDGTNCHNAGDGYNGGHPCTRGCGCLKLECDGSGNFFTEGGGTSTSIGGASKRNVYVPRKLKVYLRRDDYGLRRESGQNVEPWPSKAELKRSGSYIHNEAFDLEWSAGAWRGSVSCAPKIRLPNNKFYKHGHWVSEGGICSNVQHVTEKSCVSNNAVWSADPFSYSGRLEISSATPSKYIPNDGNTPVGITRGRVNEPDRIFESVENAWGERGFCWTTIDGIDENGYILSDAYTEVLINVKRNDCKSGGCYENKVYRFDVSQKDCSGTWVDEAEWYQDSCIKDGSKPPRLDGKCIVERTNDGLGDGSVSAPVSGKDGAQSLLITEDINGFPITSKNACEIAGATLTTAKLKGFGADNPGVPPYELRWVQGEYDKSQCCGGHVITKKSPWFIPNTKLGSTARRSRNPNPERGEVGVCYTPRKELIVYPYNVADGHSCTNFENQSDRINAKEGYYDYFAQSDKTEAGAYTAFYRGCDFYNECPQTEEEDDRGDDPLAAGRTLSLIIPQNQMLSVGNLNLTSASSLNGNHHFVSSYAGWDDKMARLGNPTPWSSLYPDWDNGGPTVWTDEIGDHDGSTSRSDKHIGIGEGRIKTYCGSGIPTSDCRNPPSNKRMTAFNLKPQPFKATEALSSEKKTLASALTDQKAHAFCLGFGCAADISHGIDHWFDNDFNYEKFGNPIGGSVSSLQLCIAKRKAMHRMTFFQPGFDKCGSCNSGPSAYLSWVPKKLHMWRNTCMMYFNQQDCESVGECRYASSGPCSYDHIFGEVEDVDINSDLIMPEDQPGCYKETCTAGAGTWVLACDFTPDPVQPDPPDDNVPDGAEEPDTSGGDQSEENTSPIGTCKTKPEVAEDVCITEDLPADIQQIVWDPDFSIPNTNGNLAYWDKTGLMPFNNASSSFVSDTCYGGTLFGGVEKASNTAPIIITSSDHKLRPGDEIEVTDVIGNFKANTLSNSQWADVHYEDKKATKLIGGGFGDQMWPHAKMTDCVTPPVGGWSAGQKADGETYTYFTVCGIAGTGKKENYLPTEDTFAICDCNGDIVDGFITKGTNIPGCPSLLDNTMSTCASQVTGGINLYGSGSVTFNVSTGKYQLEVLDPHVNISCDGDTQQQREAAGRDEQCAATCEAWGRCGIIEKWEQKLDNNGDEIRTGEDHVVCSDCLEGIVYADYEDERAIMTEANCTNLEKSYKNFYTDTPSEKHYPASAPRNANDDSGTSSWEQLSWGPPPKEPDDLGNFTPDAWKHCPFTGKWNLSYAREESDLKINVPYKIPGQKYAPGTTIPVSSTKFLGGYSIPGDMSSMAVERTDIANHWYIGIEQDGHCGGCQDHYLKTKSLIANVTEGVTSDLQKDICGYRCDGSLWYDGYCCDCSGGDLAAFEAKVYEAIEAACGKDAQRPRSNLHNPTTGPRALNDWGETCAYETETALRKTECGLCGCTYRMTDDNIESPNPCCSCECISPEGDIQPPPSSCTPDSPECGTVRYPTTATFKCCNPPQEKCDPTWNPPGVGEGETVSLGNMTCTCSVRERQFIGGTIKDIFEYTNCVPCTGFPKGRPYECQPDPMCGEEWSEGFCKGIETTDSPNGDGGTCIANPASAGCIIEDSNPIPIFCVTTGDCSIHTGCKGLGGIDIPLLWNGSSWESDWTLMNSVGSHQCSHYTKANDCLRARCIYPNGGVEIGGLHDEKFKDKCDEKGGVFQPESSSQPIPGADCGSCHDPFGQYTGPVVPLHEEPNYEERDPTEHPDHGGHFMRLSFGCDVNIDNVGGSITGGSRTIGAGFQSFESHLIDTMNLEMEITTCSVRHCAEEELGEALGWMGGEGGNVEGHSAEWSESRPPAMGGIGCTYFNSGGSNKCFQGCVSTEFIGAGYPCTGCCDINPGGGYKGFSVCAGPLIGFCSGPGKPILSGGGNPNLEKGQDYRGPRSPEFFTVHSVDMDEDGSRGYDILHVEAHHMGQPCAWVPKDPADSSDDDWEIRVGIGMADKQAAESGTNEDTYSRNMLSISQDWPSSTKLVNVIPGRRNRGDRKYFEIHVESANVLMTKASSLNRELEMRESKDSSIQSIIDGTALNDGGGNHSRKGGGSSVKDYGELLRSQADQEKFIGLDMYYNKTLPYPYGRNPWPVGVQSTPMTPWRTVFSSAGQENWLDKKLESFRKSITTGVRGRVGRRPDAVYLNYLNDKFYDGFVGTATGGGPGSPDYRPYEDIEIERVDDIYTTDYECDKVGNPTEKQCIADKTITAHDPTGSGGNWNITYEKFLHTVVHTYKPHDLTTGEKVIISDSICHVATCKHVATGICVEEGNLAAYERDPVNNPLKPDWERDASTCGSAVANNSKWLWITRFEDEDINQRECEEKPGTNPKNTCSINHPVSKDPITDGEQCILLGGTWSRMGEWVMGRRTITSGSDAHNENPDEIAINEFLAGCTPHCAVESMVIFPVHGPTAFGTTAYGACDPHNCNNLLHDGGRGTCPVFHIGATITQMCPRCSFDGSHIIKRLSDTSFALYEESYIHYEDFESSLRVSDAKKTPSDSVLHKDDYIDWLDNYDPSMNFLCEDAYANIDSSPEGVIQGLLCNADRRCTVAAKALGSLTCASYGICSTINDLYDGTPGHAERKRQICSESNHCIVGEVLYNQQGAMTKVSCDGVENPNTDNSTRNADNGTLGTHFPGYRYGAEVGIGKAKKGLTNGGIYIGQNPEAVTKWKDDVLNFNHLAQRGKWSRSGGLFDIGVGMIRPLSGLGQDFSGGSGESTDQPVKQDYRFTLPDQCCNHKYPPLLTDCAGYGRCSPGRTETIGSTDSVSGLFDKAFESSSAIINVTITEQS